MLPPLNILQSNFRGETAVSDSTPLQTASLLEKNILWNLLMKRLPFFFSGSKQDQNDMGKERCQY